MDPAYIIGGSTVFATILGPILAVQAQKYLEGKRNIKQQKMNIFSTLMATRGSRASVSHVQALNMIDLAFNGGSNANRRKTETDVLDAWRDYLDNLNSPITEQNAARWQERSNEMLIVLLSAMASDLGLRYDRVLLRSGAYIPKGHVDLEGEQQRLRQLALKVLSGEQPLSMSVVDFPVNSEFAETQVSLHEGLVKALSGQGSLSVRLEIPPALLPPVQISESEEIPPPPKSMK